MKLKEVALTEKEELQIKIVDLQQKLELQQVTYHKNVSGMYAITQSGTCMCCSIFSCYFVFITSKTRDLLIILLYAPLLII